MLLAEQKMKPFSMKKKNGRYVRMNDVLGIKHQISDLQRIRGFCPMYSIYYSLAHETESAIVCSFQHFNSWRDNKTTYDKERVHPGCFLIFWCVTVTKQINSVD